MFIGHVTGYLGSDAKKTQKGYSFNVSTKYREGNEEKTLWICCFLNYETKVAEFLKTSNPQLSSSASFLRLNVLSSLN